MEREGKEFRARDKKVLKHTKEGLVEHNLSKDMIKNISSTIEDVDLEKVIDERKIDSLDFTKDRRDIEIKSKSPRTIIRDNKKNTEHDNFSNLDDKDTFRELKGEEIVDKSEEVNEVNLDEKINDSVELREKLSHKKKYKIVHKARYKQEEKSSNTNLIFSKDNSVVSKDDIREKLNQQKSYKAYVEDSPEASVNSSRDSSANKKVLDREFKTIEITNDSNRRDKKANEEKKKTNAKVNNKSKFKHSKEKESKYFHEETDKENLIKNSVKDGISTVGLIGIGANKVYHHKMNEIDNENVGVESVHRTQTLGESAIRKTRNYSINRKNQRLKKENREISKNSKLSNRLEFNQVLKGDRNYQQSKGINKHIQRWRLKQQYNKRDRKSIGKRFIEVIKGSPKTITKMTKRVGKKAGVYISTLVFLMLIIMVSVQSCSNILMGGIGAITGTSYQASDLEVTGADAEYSRLETGLLLTLQDIETDNPGYDEYRYELDGIGHDPHELIAYLTAKFGDFSISTIIGELQKIFKKQYKLSLQEFTETYTVTETFIDPDTGENYEVDVEYEKRILLTNLISRPLGEVLLDRLDKDDKELYEVLMISKGNFMTYASPIDGDWKQYISSMFGWRIHPIHMVENLHTGLDIAKSDGEPLYAIFDGIVREVGYDANGYGHYIVIEDKAGNTALYAHCSSIVSNQGSEIKAGDTIAGIGSTGSSTGYHLHLELKNSEGSLLNPYFYLYSEAGSTIGTGIYYNGYRGNYGSPGIPYDDEDIIALFKEADKHLGKRYVFGANGPNNFDCSSFVCWVFRNSGIYNIPRTTAQGIFNQSTPISKSEAKPGDLIFFTGTYNAGVAVTHVGIYAGNGMMVHAGDPIQYTSIETNYWRNHFYSFGRLR